MSSEAWTCLATKTKCLPSGDIVTWSFICPSPTRVLDTKLSASAFLQLNSTAEAGLANMRLRYNPREGSDFYLVWNEGFNTNRLRTGPARPFTSGRALLAKYTYTFAL